MGKHKDLDKENTEYAIHYDNLLILICVSLCINS